ncbi:MAG: hypothetical protein K5656_02765 [Lachnospiraceae bacterium]|nr:hypothetical protein [Lachnospiraceae bacterium]
MPNYNIKKNDWENLDINNTKISERVRNASNEAIIANYIKDHGASLSMKELSFLEHRLESCKKINKAIRDTNANLTDEFKENQTKLSVDENKKSYILTDINQPSFQTADNGCWSCFYQMLLQSKGVNNLTQEDIRAFRPDSNDKFNQDSDIEMNTDARVNACDMGDLMLSISPDSVMKSNEIWSFNKYKGNNYGSKEEKNNYFNSAVKGVKETITNAIKRYHSPVGLMMDGHYITIIGIEGDNLLYKNSMPTAEANNNPNYTYKKDIKDVLNSALNGENADIITLTWLEDIELSKTNNKVYNSSVERTSINENSDINIQAKETQDFYIDDRHNKGSLLTTTGSIDLEDKYSAFRTHTMDGYVKTEKSYFPKSVNINRIKDRAKKRSKEDENYFLKELEERKNKTEAIYNTIKIAEINEVNNPKMEEKEELKRYKINVEYTGRAFYNCKNFTEFKNLLSGVGWDKERFATLLAAVSYIYSAVPFKNFPMHKQAIDLVFAETFFNNINSLNSVRSLKNNLREFLNTVLNGGIYYSPFGEELQLIGLNNQTLKNYKLHLNEKTKLSIDYINAYISALDEIETIAPDISPLILDIDAFIDEFGDVRTDDIADNELIKDFAVNDDSFFLFDDNNDKNVKEDKEEISGLFVLDEYNNITDINIKHEKDGVSVSDKCKYKIKNLGYSREAAKKKLKELDDIPRDKRDNDLVFNLILTIAYWKPLESYESVRFTEEDYDYLAHRYEEDPDFVDTMDKLVEYGYGRMWDNWDLLCRYIFHNPSKEYQKEEDFIESRETVADEDYISEFSNNNIQRANNMMRAEINAYQDSWVTLKEDQEELDRNLEAYSLEKFSRLQNELAHLIETEENYSYSNLPSSFCTLLARGISLKLIPKTKYASPFNVNREYKKITNQAISNSNELDNSFDFKMFFKETADKILYSDIDTITKKYIDYDQEVKESEYSLSTDVTPFFTKDLNDFNRDSVITNARNTIVRANNINSPFLRSDIVEAIDLVIAKTLLTKSAEVTFFDHITDNNGINYDLANSKINEARLSIYKDPLFRETMLKQPDSKDFYKEYMKIRNLNANKNIKEENERRKEISRVKVEEDRINDFLQNNKYTISDEQAKIINEEYNNLLKYNKSKSPTDRMTKLMNSLKAVVDEMGVDLANRDINMMKLQNLNKYVLKYYDKRQGIFFDPVTDDGKSRLAAAEKISTVTIEIMKDMRKKNPELALRNIIPEKKNAAPNKNNMSK